MAWTSRTRSAVLGALFAAAAGTGHADTVWNESLAGDLANVGTAPTVLAVGVGSNQVFGITGNPGSGIDRDYFTFAVPTGSVLSALTVLPGTGVVGSVSFIGVQDGPVMTVSPTSFSAAGLLGWTHYASADSGSSILARMGVPANGSTGFNGALPSGSYTFWVQETGAATAPYGFDFTITPVPEPASAVLALGGLGVLSAAASRRRRRCSELRGRPPGVP